MKPCGTNPYNQKSPDAIIHHCRILPIVNIEPIMNRRCSQAVLAMALALGLALGIQRPALALTFMLDFVSSPAQDIFGAQTDVTYFGGFGFSGMSYADIRAATLDAVANDYLDYPTVWENASSPLPIGKQLNLNFAMSLGQTAPVNDDSEYYFMAIGNFLPSAWVTTMPALGQACYACVRNAAGYGPNYSVLNGSIVGSIFTNNIASLAYLAGTNEQRINLIAGTIAHEIGHTLTLDHPSGPLWNPGASSFSLMATGAYPTYMPNAQRVQDRAFSYSEFNQLIAAVGTRDVPVTPVPEADTYAMLLAGLLVLAIATRRKTWMQGIAA